MHEAKYYKKLENNSCQCLLCPNYCIINNNKLGRCRAKKNIDGTLYAINYGECCSIAFDPIEKKPLYHFYPGKTILSVAPNSCNLLCPFCQNAEISQMNTSTEYVTPEALIEIALKHNSFGISYTYTEPLTWYEYLLDVGKLAHKAGLKNVLITNGMINEEPLLELAPYIDAANIDLKSMKEEFYKDVVKGDLKTVLNTIKIAKKRFHIELTNLIIPNFNDSDEEIEQLIDFVADIGTETPLHFSRFFPHYKMRKTPPTPASTLKKAYEMAKKKLRYVYIGNIDIEGTSNTYCYSCGNLLVQRGYFSGQIAGIENGKCNKCRAKADFIL